MNGVIIHASALLVLNGIGFVLIGSSGNYFAYGQSAPDNASAINSPPTNWHSYINSTYGIALLYPSDWIQSPVAQPDGTNNRNFNIMEFEPPIAQDPSANTILGVGIDNITRNTTPSLEKYVHDEINIYRSAANVTDFKVIKAGTNVTVGGYPGYLLYYTEKLRTEPTPTIYLEAGTIAGNTIYYMAIKSSVSDNQFTTVFIPQVVQMINSFKILQSTSAIQQQQEQQQGPLSQQRQQQLQSGNISGLGLTNNNNITGTGSQASNFLEYQNSTLGFSMQYPNGATIQYHNGSIVLFNLTGGNFAEVYVLSSPNLSLDDVTNQRLDILNKSFPGANLRISKDAPLAGNPGHFIIFDHNGVMDLEHWTLVRGNVYDIFFTWDPSTSPNFVSDIASKMAGSFQIIARASSSTSTNASGLSTSTLTGGTPPAH